MAPFHYMLKAPSVSNLDVIEHITVYLTSYSWKQSRILCYACCLQGAIYSFMTGVQLRFETRASLPLSKALTLKSTTPCIPLTPASPFNVYLYDGESLWQQQGGSVYLHQSGSLGQQQCGSIGRQPVNFYAHGVNHKFGDLSSKKKLLHERQLYTCLETKNLKLICVSKSWFQVIDWLEEIFWHCWSAHPELNHLWAHLGQPTITNFPSRRTPLHHGCSRRWGFDLWQVPGTYNHCCGIAMVRISPTQLATLVWSGVVPKIASC
jgi:hypothetical protein